MAKIKELYENAKTAKVGSICKCPSCGTEFAKTNYQQAFCKSKSGTKCKDKYWNTVIPDKRNNTTRISPASASFLASKFTDSRFESRDAKERYYLDDNSSHHGDCHVEPCEWCGMYAGGGCRC